MLRSLLAVSLGYFLVTGVPSTHAQLLVAHRGASHDAPENTIAAFKLAWEQDADAIEGDFYLASDGEIVCIHDDTTNRVSGKMVNLRVDETTYEDLKQIDVGSWKEPRFADERIPLLQDVLETLQNGKQLFIEIKCGPEIIEPLKEILKEANVQTCQASIISFNEDVIAAAKQVMPEREAFWLLGFDQQKDSSWQPTQMQVIATARAIGADGVDMQANREVINTSFVKACRDAGLSVHVWTVDEADAATYFQKLGVDSITTNRPRSLRRLLFSADGSLRELSRDPIAK